jgi:2-polyprenyl-3-methyl-5-hydroxy-6-metoxy-1,4-benzoquinol methylase
VRYYRQRLETEHLNPWHDLAERALRPVLRRGLTVGEFGCGSGAFLRRLVEEFGVRGIGFDISEANISRVRDLGLEGRIVDLSVEPVAIEPESLDVAVSLEVIEHLVEPSLFLRQIHRALRPGGYFCITTPNAFNLRRRLAFLLGYHHDPHLDPSRVDFAEHLRAFSFAMLERMLRARGFRVVAVSGDRVPAGAGVPHRFLRPLLSSEICILAQK